MFNLLYCSKSIYTSHDGNFLMSRIKLSMKETRLTRKYQEINLTLRKMFVFDTNHFINVKYLRISSMLLFNLCCPSRSRSTAWLKYFKYSSSNGNLPIVWWRRDFQILQQIRTKRVHVFQKNSHTGKGTVEKKTKVWVDLKFLKIVKETNVFYLNIV